MSNNSLKSLSRVHAYQRIKPSAEDVPMDYFSILAVLSGTACMFYEVRMAGLQFSQYIYHVMALCFCSGNH